MNNFIITYSTEHTKFKDFCKKKRDSISISFVDILSSQDKYLVFDDDRKSNQVLECELFIKIYDSIKNLKVNPKYNKILYYTDHLDEFILFNFVNTIESYIKEIDLDLNIKVVSLDLIDKDNEECLKKLKKQKNINLLSKESIQQTY